MKLKIISDTHLEFFNNNLLKVDRLVQKLFKYDYQPIDVLVLAGDICSLTPRHLPKLYRFLEWISEYEKPQEIYYIWGNHEYYGCDWDDDDYFIEVINNLYNLDLGESKLFVSDKRPKAIEYNNVFMSTLWYPEHPDVWLLQSHMNDFSEIKNCNPKDFIDLNRETLRLLASYTAKTRPDFWFFHHLPSYQSVITRYKTDRLNCYYVCPDVEKLILELKPKMVVHGHSHTPVEYWLGDTLVKSNPIGYPK